MKNPAAVALGSIRSEKKAAAARLNGKKGGWPKGKPRKDHTVKSVILKEYRDGSEYWIVLKKGWQNGRDRGTHAIVQETKRDAYDDLKAVIPCTCQSCQWEA